jgi:hypothetical protein
VAGIKIDPAHRRIALTLACLKVVSPDIDQNTRTKLADSILALAVGEDRNLPHRRIMGRSHRVR